MSLEARLRNGTMSHADLARLDRYTGSFSRRQFLKGALAAGIGLGLSACETALPPNGDPDPDPDPGNGDPGNGECLSGSAQEYADSVGLPLDVRILDTARDSVDGCFTVHKREWIDQLRRVYGDGVVSLDRLRSFVDHFPTVGPMIPKAFELSYDAYRVDRAYEPDVVEFVPEHMGWIPLDKIVPRLELPGVRHRLLGDPLTNYPINEDTWSFGLPDWSNLDPSRSSTFLSEFGFCDVCTATENVLNTGSIDMNVFAEVVGDWFELKWFDVYAGNLTPGRVAGVSVYSQFNPDEVRVFDMSVDWEVHPDDRSLFDVGSTIRFSYGHMTPNRDVIFDEEDVGFKRGDVIAPGTRLGYINPRFASYELDFSVDVRGPFGLGPYIPIPEHLGFDFDRIYVMDILGADVYPVRRRPQATQPRYRDKRLLSPYTVDGVMIPEPSEP